MARGARRKSETGIYHVVLKTIDKRVLFGDDIDREYFMVCLRRAMDKGKFQLYAYCLMNNHVHLVMREGESVGKSIQRLTVSYIWHYRRKYKSEGHIFKNRFFSNVVSDEDYFYRVIRYTHQNPAKSNIVDNLNEYRWSSYCQYLKLYRGAKSYISGESLMTFFTGIDDFIHYHQKFDGIDFDDNESLGLYKMKEHLLKLGYTVNRESDGTIGEMIRDILKLNDLSARKLASIVGVNRNKIGKWIKSS